MSESLPVVWPPFRKPLRPLRYFRYDGMRPGFAEAESRRSFLGDKFAGGFDDGAKWVAHHAGVFTVGVVDAPQLIARLQSRGRAHSRS